MGSLATFLPVGQDFCNFTTLTGCANCWQCLDEGVDNAPDGNVISTGLEDKLASIYCGDGNVFATMASYPPGESANLIRVRLYWSQDIAGRDLDIKVLDRAGVERASWLVSNPDTSGQITVTPWEDVSSLSQTLFDYHYARVRLNSNVPSAWPRIDAVELEIDYGVTLSTSSSSSSITQTTSSTSSSYYPYWSTLEGAITLKLRSIIAAAEAGKKLKPIARVIVENTETGEEVIIDDVTNFGVRVSTDASADSFQLTIGGSEIWTPRGILHPDLILVSQKRLYKIFGGYRIDGQDYYIPFFVGVPTADPMSVGGSSRSIAIRGYGKEQLLLKTDGYLSGYTGYAKDLVEYYLELAGIENWWLAFDDYYIDTQDMNYMNAYQAVASILSVPGNVEFFFDPEGAFIAQKFGGTQEPELTVRDTTNLFYLNRATQASRIFTVVDVLGTDDDASATRYAAQEKLDQYGRNVRVFSSNLITTLEEAENYGDSIIAESLLYENAIQFRMPFLPYLRAGSLVTIYDAASLTLNEDVRLKSISVYFKAGQSSRIDATGVIVE